MHLCVCVHLCITDSVRAFVYVFMLRQLGAKREKHYASCTLPAFLSVSKSTTKESKHRDD